MNNDIPSRRSDIIAEEAAEYFVALRTPDAKTRAEFIDWLKVSPEHVNEFLAVAALWDNLPQVSTQESREVLIQLAASDDNVVALSGLELGQLSDNILRGHGRSDLRKRYVPRRWFGFAAAAVLAAVFVGGVVPQLLPLLDPNLYRTAVGEQTSISLADGSIVTLNTQSTIRVDYSEEFRVIHLTEGEALFDVAKDPERPFRVITGSTVIQAVGTQFNVRSIAEDVTVTVVEGIVDVSAKASRTPTGELRQVLSSNQSAPSRGALEPVRRLTVGQQARIESRSDQVEVIAVPVVENALAWQQRRLVFEHLSLKEVIDEFNRYNHPRIAINDPELRNLPISGVFRANDRESFVEFLSEMKLAESQTRGDGTIILRSVSAGDDEYELNTSKKR